MRRTGITLIEGIIVVAMLAVLAAVLWPVVTRPTPFTRLPISPLNFRNAELQTVVAKLDQELRKHNRQTLSRVRWEKEELRHRRVTLNTQEELPLGAIFPLLEQTARIKIVTGGLCGTCGGPLGLIVVRDLNRAHAREPAPHPTACAQIRLFLAADAGSVLAAVEPLSGAQPSSGAANS